MMTPALLFELNSKFMNGEILHKNMIYNINITIIMTFMYSKLEISA